MYTFVTVVEKMIVLGTITSVRRKNTGTRVQTPVPALADF